MLDTSKKILSRKAPSGNCCRAAPPKENRRFANGCFDTLHVAMFAYLEGAKAEGASLIVGVNADASVGILKGPGRPILTKARGPACGGHSSSGLCRAFSEPTGRRCSRKSSRTFTQKDGCIRRRPCRNARPRSVRNSHCDCRRSQKTFDARIN